jgi:hypothetical protein
VGCCGTADERDQVVDNRANFTITSYSVGPATVSVNFGGTCAFRTRPGDACSNSNVSWTSTDKRDGKVTTVAGVDQVAAVYRDTRWWLCDSQFDGKLVSGSSLRFFQLLTRER